MFRQNVQGNNNNQGGVLNVSDRMHRLTTALAAMFFTWFRQNVQGNDNGQGGVLNVSDRMHRLTTALAAVFFPLVQTGCPG